MELITHLLTALPEFQQLLSAIDSGQCPAAVTGLSAVHRAHFAAALSRQTGRSVALVCADESEADRLARDLAALTGQETPVLSARAFTLHTAASVSRQWEHRRLGLLRALQDGRLPLIVCTVEGLLQRTLDPTSLKGACRTLEVGQTYDLPRLAEDLIAEGYARSDQVEGAGQFALRGGILDVFSPEQSRPVRAEFFGDELDSMGFFDPGTQRRTENVSRADLIPAAEVLPQLACEGLDGLLSKLDRLTQKARRGRHNELAATLEADWEALSAGRSLPTTDRYLPLIYPQMATAADFLPPDTCVLFAESSRLAERARTYQWQLEEDVQILLERGELDPSCTRLALTFDELNHHLEDFPVAYLDSFPLSSYPVPPKTLLPVITKQLPCFGLSLETAASDLTSYQKANFSTLVLVGGEQRALNLQSMLREHKVRSAVDFKPDRLPPPGQITISVGGLSAGLEYPELRVAILTEGQGIPVKRPRHTKNKTNRQKLESFTDLSPGDLVVHESYGIGRFAGIERLVTDGVEKDYIKLCYAGSDVLYIPATQLDVVSKYIGSGEDSENKKLSKLGGTDWEKAKRRTKKAVQDLAKGLIQLYAQRQNQPGYAFSPDSPWQREFEEQFEYEETDDQLRCVAEIKRDMERPIPMDRLLCGDVGYGKTEVAFRAVMKCVLDGRQAAILAPTTVLARQHYLTALKRFAKFPVNIDVISRFRTSAQMRETLRRVQAGQVDLLIGTHRLFNKDVKFKDLGLLVVDEEQRFGVTHKEKLKQNFRQVDVLTLSATPIPRTLNMSLSGIRDMSILEEPPQNRQPVQTYVLEHDWGVLADAMRRELERGGQVFYLHNRVETIDRTAAHIQEILGEDVAVGVAHGQMDQEDIDEVMSRMTDGELGVLVCTTIIETGIDLPNTNTLIIEDADRLGLAQLHQLRGRVGRSARRAYAYLTYRQGKVLTEVASKRLSAIREFAEFGSGFKIAMRDLEIRGAGNILGPEQSGFLMSVGYDMYLKLLEEAVLTQQGKTPPQEHECSADLAVSASIPERYVPSPEQRMDLYRRIARIREKADANELVDELIDRYGDVPEQVNNLISVALLRVTAAGCGITDISQKKDSIRLSIPSFDLRQISDLCGAEKYRGRLLFSPEARPYLSLRLRRGEDPLQASQAVVADYAKICKTE